MFILLIGLFLLPAFDAKSHNDINTTYIHCSDDSIQKHVNFSYPGKELICEDVKNINGNDVIERTVWKKKKNKAVIQFISVSGSLHRKLLTKYPSVTTVLVYKSEITDFSLQISSGQLIIAESVFPRVTTSTFREAEDIGYLGFYSNPGLIFDDRCFSDLSHLRNLTIYNQTLSTLRASTLVGLTKLRRLVCMDDDLSEIDTDAFRDNLYLREIILDYNPLEHFKANITFLKHLRKLSLLNTNLKKLNLPLFSPMQRLTTLSLSNEAWLKISVVELAQAFPGLRTAIFNKNEEETKDLKQLIEGIESAGVAVKRIEEPKKSSIYEEDMAPIY